MCQVSWKMLRTWQWIRHESRSKVSQSRKLSVEAFYKKEITLCSKCSDQGKKRGLITTEDLGETRHLLQHKVVSRLLEEKIPEWNLPSRGCRAIGMQRRQEGCRKERIPVRSCRKHSGNKHLSMLETRLVNEEARQKCQEGGRSQMCGELVNYGTVLSL